MRNMITVLLLCLTASEVNAAIVHFSASGHLASEDGSSGAFSMTMAFDSSVVDSEPFDPDTGVYGSSFGGGIVTFNDVAYTEVGSANSIVVYNGFSGSPNVDTFALSLLVQSDQGVLLEVNLRLVDSTNSVFSDDSHPNDLTVDQFDPFNALDPYNGTIASLFFLDSGVDFIGPVGSAELTPVPAPAAVWLFLSAMAMFRGCSKRK